MLESFILIATGWLISPLGAGLPTPPSRDEHLAADEAILKKANIPTDDEALLGFFKKRTLADNDRETVLKLIRQLGSDIYRLRELAMAELVGRGPAILEMLQQAAKDNDLEITRRVEKCIARIHENDVPVDTIAAATRLLADRKPAAAVETMLAYLPIADIDNSLDEACNLLALLAKKDSKAHPALVAALINPLPVRRAAAGESLCRAGLDDQKHAIKKLLGDPDPYVRLRIGLALANAGDREAIPVLIDALPRLTLVQAWQAEDVLLRLAEGKSPPAVSLGTEESARIKCRAAWQAWWKDNGPQVDLARLRESPPMLGYTLIVLLDIGRIMELGADNQVRWQFDDLIFPLDAQVLSGERVLVAEYHASRVTERNFKGEVLWKKDIAGPLVAQRLANGNTFIATANQILEIDRADKTVVSFAMPDSEHIMKAAKLPNGEIACLTSSSRVVRLDANGKIIHGFNVALGEPYSGGRIYMLPNGRVLIPHKAENKVVEYDARGKSVWEVIVDQPVAAIRLANGNTLVTTMVPQRGAVEFDRNGHEVWSYRSTTRVTRALRR